MLLQVKDLHTYYGNIKALRGVSFYVDEGEIRLDGNETRLIRRSALRHNIGMVLQAVTACLGLLFAVVFILLGAYKDISGAVLLLYHIICTVVTVLSVRMKDT